MCACHCSCNPMVNKTNYLHLYTSLEENFIFSKPTKYASKPTTQGNLNRRCFQLRITIPADDNLEGIEHCIIGETHINPLPMPQFKLDFFFKKWAIPGLFFFIFVFSIQLTVNVQYNFLLMTGFEQQTSGNGSNRSTNWATTTAPSHISLLRQNNFVHRKIISAHANSSEMSY